MSEFRTDRPIYRQIVDYACALILKGQWLPGEKIPSVRELAVGMGVNSHTVLKAFDELQQQGLITRSTAGAAEEQAGILCRHHARNIQPDGKPGNHHR